jgi:hypothetical protein
MIYDSNGALGERGDLDGDVVNHPAELVRGDSLLEGPFIRPWGTFSPRGEGWRTARTGSRKLR